MADFPEPSSEHAREKSGNETSGQSDPEPDEQNRGSGSYLNSHQTNAKQKRCRLKMGVSALLSKCSDCK